MQYIKTIAEIKIKTDEELLDGILSGSFEDFSLFVNRYKDMVFRLCYSIIRKKEDAEDVAQEVFIQVFKSIEQFRKESKISTWLYRVSVNKSINYKKKNKRYNFLDLVENSFFISNNSNEIQDSVINEDLENIKSKILFQSLEKLPDSQKTAFLLHHQEGLSYHEISDVLGTTHSAVESLIHRAKQNLNKYIISEYKKQRIFERF